MGKSWKEKPWKYKTDKNFQKKQKHKKGQKPVSTETPDHYSPFEDPPEHHESFA